MPPDGRDDNSEVLVTRARAGERAAREKLLGRYRDRLKRMVAVRMDPRIAPRVDPSDVVQEALIEADRKLDRYLETVPMPFYPWLRHIAWERLVKLHEHHLQAAKRSVKREQRGALLLSDHSAADLASRFAGTEPGPATRAVALEIHERVLKALNKLKPIDREVLVLRHLEQLSVREVAAITELTETNVKVRCLRALERLRQILAPT